MRVKVGSTWYTCSPGQPILVELAPQDKKNIENMVPGATKYAVFDDRDGMSVDEKYAWMSEGCDE